MNPQDTDDLVTIVNLAMLIQERRMTAAPVFGERYNQAPAPSLNPGFQGFYPYRPSDDYWLEMLLKEKCDAVRNQLTAAKQPPLPATNIEYKIGGVPPSSIFEKFFVATAVKHGVLHDNSRASSKLADYLSIGNALNELFGCGMVEAPPEQISEASASVAPVSGIGSAPDTYAEIELVAIGYDLAVRFVKREQPKNDPEKRMAILNPTKIFTDIAAPLTEVEIRLGVKKQTVKVSLEYGAIEMLRSSTLDLEKLLAVNNFRELYQKAMVNQPVDIVLERALMHNDVLDVDYLNIIAYRNTLGEIQYSYRLSTEILAEQITQEGKVLSIGYRPRIVCNLLSETGDKLVPIDYEISVTSVSFRDPQLPLTKIQQNVLVSATPKSVRFITEFNEYLQTTGFYKTLLKYQNPNMNGYGNKYRLPGGRFFRKFSIRSAHANDYKGGLYDKLCKYSVSPSIPVANA